MPGNLQRKSRRQKQSRLVFESIGSGSGSGAPRSPARIRYAGPGSKKKKAVSVMDDENGFEGNDVNEIGGDVEKALPTPQRSSQLKDAVISADHSEAEKLDNHDSDLEITSSHRISIDVEEPEDLPRLTAPARWTPTKRSTRNSRHSLYKIKTGDSSESSPDEDDQKEKKEEEESPRPERTPSKNAVLSFVDENYNLDKDEDESGYSDRPYQPGLNAKRISKITTPRSFIAGGSSYTAPIGSSGKRNSSTRKSTTPQKSKRRSVTPTKISKIVEPIDLTSDEDEDDDNNDIGMPTPKATQASSQRSKHLSSSVFSSRRSRRNAITVESDSDSDDDNLPTFSQIKKKSFEPMKPSLQVNEESDDDDDDVVSSPLKRRRLVPKLFSDDENGDDVVSSPLKRKRAAPKKVEANEDEDIEVVISPLKRKRAVAEVGDDDSDDSDDLVILPTPALRKGKQKALSDDSDNESDSDMLPSPTKKLKTRLRNSSTPRKSQGRLTRQQQEKKKLPKRTPRQKTLELLRRRRAGEKISELTDSGSEEEQGAALYDSASSLEALSNFDDESESDNVQEKKRKKSRKAKNSEGAEEDDFVVDDDEEVVGVPGMGLHDIPVEFTHAAHKRKKEHFKDAVEWMVQRKINPAFNRSDPVYALAFRKLDDELRGYAMSNFASSVWRENFTRALFARPIFLETYTGVGFSSKCEACNRSGHPATFTISFSGKAYHKSTLEDVDNDPDSDDDSEHQEYNENGERIPDESKEYQVGSVCKANAETAHRLTHWKYALNEWVVDQLKVEKYLTPANLAAREELNTKKRSKIAEGIVDSWEASNQIHELYSLLKAQLEEASQGQQRGRGRR